MRSKKRRLVSPAADFVDVIKCRTNWITASPKVEFAALSTQSSYECSVEQGHDGASDPVSAKHKHALTTLRGYHPMPLEHTYKIKLAPGVGNTWHSSHASHKSFTSKNKQTFWAAIHVLTVTCLYNILPYQDQIELLVS